MRPCTVGAALQPEDIERDHRSSGHPPHSVAIGLNSRRRHGRAANRIDGDQPLRSAAGDVAHRALSVAVGTILSLIERGIISLANETRTYGDLCDCALNRRVGWCNRIQA